MNNRRYSQGSDVAVVYGEPDSGGEAATVFVALLPNGPLAVLEGTASEIWRAAVGTSGAALERPVAAGSTESEVVVRVAARTGQTEDEVRADVLDFLVRLVERGLLRVGGPTEAPEGPGSRS